MGQYPAGKMINYRANASFPDPAKNGPYTYSWVFSDGNIQPGGEYATNTFYTGLDDGTVTATVTVTNTGNDNEIATATIVDTFTETFWRDTPWWQDYYSFESNVSFSNTLSMYTYVSSSGGYIIAYDVDNGPTIMGQIKYSNNSYIWNEKFAVINNGYDGYTYVAFFDAITSKLRLVRAADPPVEMTIGDVLKNYYAMDWKMLMPVQRTSNRKYTDGTINSVWVLPMTDGYRYRFVALMNNTTGSGNPFSVLYDVTMPDFVQDNNWKPIMVLPGQTIVNDGTDYTTAFVLTDGNDIGVMYWNAGNNQWYDWQYNTQVDITSVPVKIEGYRGTWRRAFCPDWYPEPESVYYFALLHDNTTSQPTCFSFFLSGRATIIEPTIYSITGDQHPTDRASLGSAILAQNNKGASIACFMSSITTMFIAADNGIDYGTNVVTRTSWGETVWSWDNTLAYNAVAYEQHPVFAEMNINNNIVVVFCESGRPVFSLHWM